MIEDFSGVNPDARYEDRRESEIKVGDRLASVLYILVAAMLIIVGILNIILCEEYHYFFRFWTGLLILVVGITGFIYSRDSHNSWRIWWYISFTIIAVLATYVSLALLLRILSPETDTFAGSYISLTVYDNGTVKSKVPSSNVATEPVTWVCFAMDWFSFVCLCTALTILTSAIQMFNHYWAANYTSTQSIEPFCTPVIFNPWGQAQLGQAMAVFGIIAVYICTYDASDTFWAKYWGPVWAGALAVFAGCLTGIAGKREDLMKLSVAAVVLQIVSMLSSASAVVLCTLGMVDNIKTAKHIDEDFLSGYKEMDNVIVVRSAAIYAISDVVMLVNILYIFAALIRHFRNVCRCSESGYNQRNPSYEQSQYTQHPGQNRRNLSYERSQYVPTSGHNSRNLSYEQSQYVPTSGHNSRNLSYEQSKYAPSSEHNTSLSYEQLQYAPSRGHNRRNLSYEQSQYSSSIDHKADKLEEYITSTAINRV